MKSIGDSRNIYWYAKYDSTIDEDVQQYLIFNKIIDEYRRKWSSDEDKSYFLRKEEQKNIKLYEDIKEKIEKSLINGTYIYQGKEFPTSDKSDLKSIFEDIANLAIPKVYHRFDMVGIKIIKEDIQSVFKGNQLSIDLSGLNLIQDTNVNAESAVLKEVLNEIKTLKNKYGQCIGKDLLSVFDNEPYGWASEAVRLFTALLFKNGNIELNYEGKDFLDYNQSGVRDIFENEPNFRKAIFKLAVVVGASTRQKCQDILMNMFNKRSEDTLVELYSNTRNVLIDYRNDISAIKEIISSNNLAFKDSIEKLDVIFNTMLKSKTQGETINNFVQKFSEYGTFLSKYKKLKSFIDNGNLKEYKKMKHFLNNVWIIEIDRNTADIKTKEKIYDQIMNDLKSESFVDSWSNVRENFYKLYDPYVKEYIETHEILYKLYNEKIEEMRKNKSFLNLKSEIGKGDILSTFSDKLCSHSITKLEIPCPICRTFIRDMKTIIDAVDVYQEKAMDKLYKYLNKQIEEEREEDEVEVLKPVIKHLSTKSFPKNVLLKSPKSVKDYLKKIEKQLMEDISAGNSIMIE